MNYRRNDNAGLPVLALVAIVVALALIGVVVAYPYLTRADDYANPPDDPPAEVDDPAADPDWQGKFAMDIAVTTAVTLTGVKVSKVTIEDCSMALETYDGPPWSAASLWAATQWGAESYPAHYVLSITKGSTTYKDMGSFKVYKDDNYDATGKSRYFFFWEEQEGNWQYDLTVTCSGKIAHTTGTLGLSGGKALVN